MSEIQRVALTPAMVLHRRPYRNSSLIVEFFTRSHGRVTAVARSARGPRSRYQGQLQPFVPLLISWTGRGELKSLGQIELHGLAYLLEGSALSCGFYLNELLMRLLGKEDPESTLYDRYVTVLSTLQSQSDSQAQLRYFECHLLSVLGYGLGLGHDQRVSTEIKSDRYYQYVFEQGFLQIDDDDDTNALPGSMLLALARETLTQPEELRLAKRLMRTVITRHLGGRPVHSRDLFDVT